jgi:phage-related protein
VPDKLLQWLASSRSDVRAFPRDARRLAGFQLRRVQQGLDPADWKAMRGVGPGVREIRIHTALEHRVLYVAKFAEAVYVLHAFEKRSRRTAKRDVELARQRYRELIRQRQVRRLTGGQRGEET